MVSLRRFRGRDPSRRFYRALLLAAAVLGIARAEPAIAGDPSSQNSIQIVRAFAEAFEGQQNSDGSYSTGPNVQTHLKAEIAMALAAQVTGRQDFLSSAHRDLSWVIANRLEQNGGINWNGPQNDYFFEVHQHWFLIASEMIRRQESDAASESIKDIQRSVWMYLLRSNPGGADFYADNDARHGVFFAYRDVDRRGRYQTQAPFKGSYEIGAALWSMALHGTDEWLMKKPGGTIDTTLAPSRYLARMVPQVIRPLEQHGFFDHEKGLWVRSVIWNGVEWTGYEPHDFKYVPHMEEGAILYSLLTGRTELVLPARVELEDLLSRVYPDGTVRGVPDGNGSAAYEYGTILSCLGLGARLFWSPEPDLGNRAYDAAERVFWYAARAFEAYSSEDRAVLLAGFCRVVEAEHQTRGFAQGGEAIGTRSAGSSNGAVASSMDAAEPMTLLAWPNPMRDRIQFLYSIPSNTAGLLRVVDATGRRCMTLNLESDAQGRGRLSWDGLDDGRRRLPSGYYQAVLQSGGNRRITGFAILR